MENLRQLRFEGIPRQKRPIPRPFQFPWGCGQIIEEASIIGEHHEPCIQLLEFSNGFELIRFCSYTLNGKFERNSWIAGNAEISKLAKELHETPRIRRFLLNLLDLNTHA
jgi:hypothetical protein